MGIESWSGRKIENPEDEPAVVAVPIEGGFKFKVGEGDEGKQALLRAAMAKVLPNYGELAEYPDGSIDVKGIDKVETEEIIANISEIARFISENPP